MEESPFSQDMNYLKANHMPHINQLFFIDLLLWQHRMIEL